MRRSLTSSMVPLLSYTLTLAVILIGVHAKDLSAMSKNIVDHTDTQPKKAVSDGGGDVKVQSELHPHTDRQTIKGLTKAVGDQTSLQADAKHLRRVKNVQRKKHRMLRFNLQLLAIKV